MASQEEQPEQGVTAYHDKRVTTIGHKRTLVRIVTKEEVGALASVLAVFAQEGISLKEIRSTPFSVGTSPGWEFDVTVEGRRGEELSSIEDRLRELSCTVSVRLSSDDIPWFPLRFSDLDNMSAKVKEMGEELSADHPGATDDAYRRRRFEICQLAKTHDSTKPIPRVDYLPEEIETWGIVYSRLHSLYETHACDAHRRIFPLLEQMCGYSPSNIPQLEDVSQFLSSVTGWSIRPVTGLLTARDFLNAFAFRVFHSTQYIRHHSKPFYTPEPDVCHELLGHVPLFADPDFADFSHEIGLASLGASDSEIEKLATVYWFTVEFGLCKERGGELRAFGAGLLSSFGELEYCLSDKPKLLPFEPTVAATQPYPITEYQPVYFVAESFEVMKRQMRWFASSLSRPFPVYFNPLTRSIEVLDSREKLRRLSVRINHDVQALTEALQSSIF